jgi:SAM-dependent methyltransferase
MTTDARMTPGEAREFYGEAYYRQGDYVDYRRSEPLIKRNFCRFVRRMRRVHEGRRLLEVGCAYGFFLEVASETWDVHGIDISIDATAACSSSLSGRVTAGDLLSHPFPLGTFDWVVAWDTIEHVSDPGAFSRRFWQLLEPGGCVAMTTGDVTSLVARLQGRRWRLLTPPSHLTFFSKVGIRRLLQDSGFEDIRIGTAGYTRSLDFMLYRLLRPETYAAVRTQGRWLYDLVAPKGLYLNLGDIMFVTARRPR